MKTEHLDRDLVTLDIMERKQKTSIFVVFYINDRGLLMVAALDIQTEIGICSRKGNGRLWLARSAIAIISPCDPHKIPLSNIECNADAPSLWSDTVTLYHSSRQLRRRTIAKSEW